MFVINVFKFNEIINKYKKCPNCGCSYKSNKLKVELKDEVVTISCKCGFYKKVDENNKKVK